MYRSRVIVAIVILLVFAVATFAAVVIEANLTPLLLTTRSSSVALPLQDESTAPTRTSNVSHQIGACIAIMIIGTQCRGF